MICSFFGHRDYGTGCEDSLLEEIEKLILTLEIDTFYVGNKGRFDRSVHTALKIMKRKYPYIKTYIVLDGVEPPKPQSLSLEEGEYLKYIEHFELLIPDGIENVPKRYAMSYRNRWMVRECDIAVVYSIFTGTNTKKYVDLLLQAGKPVINLAEINYYD